MLSLLRFLEPFALVAPYTRAVIRGATWLLVACTLGLAACDACAPEPPPRVRPTDPPDRNVPPPTSKQLDELFAVAAKDLTSAASEKKQPPRYRVARCKLGYELRAVDSIEVTPDRPNSKRETTTTFEALAHPDRSDLWVMRALRVVRTDYTYGKKQQGQPIALQLAPVLLKTDGREWLEVDGPTQTWATFGQFPGLSNVVPSLPRRAGSKSGASFQTSRQRERGQSS